MLLVERGCCEIQSGSLANKLVNQEYDSLYFALMPLAANGLLSFFWLERLCGLFRDRDVGEVCLLCAEVNKVCFIFQLQPGCQNNRIERPWFKRRTLNLSLPVMGRWQELTSNSGTKLTHSIIDTQPKHEERTK